MEADFETALNSLIEARRGEGKHLADIVIDHLSAIEVLVEAASRVGAVQPENQRARLKAQVDELLQASPALPEERLAQEAAILATKADVREELDRLGAHCKAARALLDAAGAVGRRLDFLCQELNREANTLCSKSSDVELTTIGIGIKSAIDQLREQVQNIE